MTKPLTLFLYLRILKKRGKRTELGRAEQSTDLPCCPHLWACRGGVLEKQGSPWDFGRRPPTCCLIRNQRTTAEGELPVVSLGEAGRPAVLSHPQCPGVQTLSGEPVGPPKSLLF